MGEPRPDLLAVTGAGERALNSIARIQLANYSVRQTVVSLATLGEVHVSEMLEALISEGQERRSQFDKVTLNRAQKDIYGTWKSLFEWLRTGFAIKISGDAPVQSFTNFVELRNLIVHGDLRLTRMQSRDALSAIDTRNRLQKSLPVTFNGSFVVIDPSTRDHAISITRSFIVHFDGAILAKYPDMLSHGAR